MRAAIIGHAPLRASGSLRALLAQADLIVCADGGVQTAQALRLPPHVVIGDLDSAQPGTLQWAHRHGATVLRFPVEKDQTDAELATQFALDAGATAIDYFGMLGGRIDHALANIGLLTRAATRHCRARILDGNTVIFLADRRTLINGAPGDQVSLVPLSERVAGVTLRGLRYPLRDGALSIGSTLGISNEIVRPPAMVRVKRGSLLVIVTHRQGTREPGSQGTGKRPRRIL